MPASTSHPIVLGFMRKSMRQNPPGRFCLLVSQGSDPLAHECEQDGVIGAHFLARDRVCAKSCGLVTEAATTGAHYLAEAPRIAVWWLEARPQMHIPWQNHEQVPQNAALWSARHDAMRPSRNLPPGTRASLGGEYLILLYCYKLLYFAIICYRINRHFFTGSQDGPACNTRR